MDIKLIKEKLKQKHMTYDDLANKTNLSISTIKKILSGTAKYPRIDTVQAIEKALGLNTKIETETDFLTKDLLAWFNKLSTFQKKYIIETTKFLCLQNKE